METFPFNYQNKYIRRVKSQKMEIHSQSRSILVNRLHNLGSTQRFWTNSKILSVIDISNTGLNRLRKFLTPSSSRLGVQDSVKLGSSSFRSSNVLNLYIKCNIKINNILDIKYFCIRRLDQFKITRARCKLIEKYIIRLFWKSKQIKFMFSWSTVFKFQGIIISTYTCVWVYRQRAGVTYRFEPV